MKAHLGIIVLLLLCLLFGFAYSVLLPPWEAPDENAHFIYVQNIARGPEVGDKDTYESSQSPLYYWLASWPLKMLQAIEPKSISMYAPTSDWENVTRPVPVFDWTTDNFDFTRLVGLYTLRWLGVLTMGISLLFIYNGVMRFTNGSTPIALATVAAAGLTPQFLHINASVNNDVLAILSGSILFWVLAYLVRERPGWPLLIGITLMAIIIPLVTKLTVMPLTLSVILASGWHTARRLESWRSRVLIVGLLGLFALLLALALLYTPAGKDALGQLNWRLTFIRADALEPFRIINRYAVTYWGLVGWVAVGFSGRMIGLLTSVTLLGWLVSLRLLFPQILVEGSWRRPLIPNWRPFLLAVACLLLLLPILALLVVNVPAIHNWRWAWVLAGIGWIAWWLLSKPAGIGSRAGWLFVWLAVAFSLAVVGRNALATDKFQGRFLFPSIGALMLLATTGLYMLAPVKLRKYFVPLITIGMASLNLFLWFSGVIPVYFQPWLD